jgi:hypothetical protein
VSAATVFRAPNGTPVREAMALTPEQREWTVEEYNAARCKSCGAVEVPLMADGDCHICAGVSS